MKILMNISGGLLFYAPFRIPDIIDRFAGRCHHGQFLPVPVFFHQGLFQGGILCGSFHIEEILLQRFRHAFGSYDTMPRDIGC